ASARAARGRRRRPEVAPGVRPLPRGGRDGRGAHRVAGEPVVNLGLPGQRGRFTRMGVLNLYEDAIEAFGCDDGTIMTTGANGGGKSPGQELTYPLLLEGNIAEYRVDTTGKRGRPFAWNLSLGDVYTRRVGYAWLEALVPVGEDGETEHVT